MISASEIDWDKGGGLVPAIVQDRAGVVRMLGYMDRAALEATLDSGLITFFSRSRQRLWVKGETSGNRLRLVDAVLDCDRDALLIRAEAEGPTCHTGAASCFPTTGPFFPQELEKIVDLRLGADPQASYTARLAGEGVKRIAQKVGEEGVELALAAVAGDRTETVAEAADLVFHLTLLLRASGLGWAEVGAELERRHRASSATASS